MYMFSAIGALVNISAMIAQPPQRVTEPVRVSDPYCNCELDDVLGQPLGWDSFEIWLDVVFVMDVSEAMSETQFEEAISLIDTLIGYDDCDNLVTDATANFYTRIGVIAVAESAKVIYNLNMTRDDEVQGKVEIVKGERTMNSESAFEAALIMFHDGLRSMPDRATTRQVIYYMSNSDSSSVAAASVFKQSQGVIIVNNFVENGAIGQNGLKDLASPGFYHTNSQASTMSMLQLFCKANCYCGSGLIPYSGHNRNPSFEASGGCFRTTSDKTPYAPCAVGNKNC